MDDWESKVPPRGTPEHDAWLLGARTEADLQVEGMTADGKEVYEFVKVVAQQGASRDWLVEYTATVFCVDWSFKKRLQLAWKILFERD